MLAEAAAERVAARATGLARFYGFGSVFAKGLRDSRLGLLLGSLAMAGITLVQAGVLASQFPTLADRILLVGQMDKLPRVIIGLLGDPINVERLGGFLSWRTLNFMPVVVGLWSIVALTGTLAGEARAGSLELVVSTPHERRSIALQKVAVHLVGLTLVMIASALAAWFAGLAFASLPGDAIGLGDALSHMVWLGLTSLVSGALAFAVAPFLGRTAAAGVGIAASFGAFLVNGYASVVPAFESLSGLSWFSWAAGHRPLAGVSDPGSLVPLALVSAVALLIGAIGFERRDLGAAITLPTGGLTDRGLGLGGPARRSLAERIPVALAWGVGIGLYGAIIGASSRAFAEQLAAIPGMDRLFTLLYPDVDWRTAAGMLDLVFARFAQVMLGIAAATLVAGWATDERGRRLDMLLAAPISRVRWTVASGAGLFVALATLVGLAGAGVAIGALAVGDDPVRPFVGALAMSAFPAAVSGIGLAVGGLLGSSLAGPVAAGVAVGMFLLDLIGTALRLPDWILNLSLTRHIGHPMVGTFDGPGIALSLTLAVGGLAVAAWGLARRDLSA